MTVLSMSLYINVSELSTIMCHKISYLRTIISPVLNYALLFYIIPISLSFTLISFTLILFYWLVGV